MREGTTIQNVAKIERKSKEKEVSQILNKMLIQPSINKSQLLLEFRSD